MFVVRIFDLHVVTRSEATIFIPDIHLKYIMIKRSIPLLLLAGMVVFLTACPGLEQVVSTTDGVLDGIGTEENKLTNDEVVKGLKEALAIGSQNAANLASVAGGFQNNSRIKIPFPADAENVKQQALDLGLNAQVEKFEQTMNRAAEEAAKASFPIFKEAILGMSVSDGFKILNGADDAATTYLKDNTKAALTAEFKPKVKAAIEKVKLTSYWNPIMHKYNAVMALTGGQKISPDLEVYITERAIAGLFILMKAEEKKIRDDPAARISDLLKKVFGSVTGG